MTHAVPDRALCWCARGIPHAPKLLIRSPRDLARLVHRIGRQVFLLADDDGEPPLNHQSDAGVRRRRKRCARFFLLCL